MRRVGANDIESYPHCQLDRWLVVERCKADRELLARIGSHAGREGHRDPPTELPPTPQWNIRQPRANLASSATKDNLSKSRAANSCPGLKPRIRLGSPASRPAIKADHLLPTK
jgi:hypothetical protein